MLGFTSASSIMSLSDTLSVIAIAISVLFGVWGILAVRRAKYSASLTFVREQSVALLEDFARKIPHLSVSTRTPWLTRVSC